MKTRWVVAGGMLVALLACQVWAADKEEDKGSFWMQKKLEYSEKILAGLATQDFEQVGKNARAMNALTQMEKWIRGGTPPVSRPTADFPERQRTDYSHG